MAQILPETLVLLLPSPLHAGNRFHSSSYLKEGFLKGLKRVLEGIFVYFKQNKRLETHVLGDSHLVLVYNSHLWKDQQKHIFNLWVMINV